MAPVLGCLITGIQLDAAAAAPGCLPAILLGGDGTPGDLGAHLDHLIGRGWSYAEPPVRLTPIPPSRSDPHLRSTRRPMLLVPCPPMDEQSLTHLGAAPRSHSEWSQRVRQLGRRCAVVLAPTVDARASGLRQQLDCEASLGRVVWTTIQITGDAPEPAERTDLVTP